MAIETPHPTGAPVQDHVSYVDWPAIFAGAVLATAISLLMLTFGSAIGLSLTEPLGRTDAPLFWAAIAIAVWLVWVQVSAFLVGGYVTGRLRRRISDASEHEVDVRDGLHGLIVWGAGVVFTGLLALGGLGHFATAASNVAGTAAGGAIEATADNGATDPFDATIDILFRGADGDAADPRAEATRIVFNGVTGQGVTDTDRQYLAELVASRTALSAEQAQTRVDEVIGQAQVIQDDIAEAAEQARITGILVAFVTAASLAVSAAAAYFAAGMGGEHRDKNTRVAFFDRPRRRV